MICTIIGSTSGFSTLAWRICSNNPSSICLLQPWFCLHLENIEILLWTKDRDCTLRIYFLLSWPVYLSLSLWWAVSFIVLPSFMFWVTASCFFSKWIWNVLQKFEINLSYVLNTKHPPTVLNPHSPACGVSLERYTIFRHAAGLAEVGYWKLNSPKYLYILVLPLVELHC